MRARDPHVERNHMTQIVLSTGKSLCTAIVRDPGVHRAAMGAVVAVGVAIAKFSFFGGDAT